MQKSVADAILRTLESANEMDCNMEAANVVDGLFEIARSLEYLAATIGYGKSQRTPAEIWKWVADRHYTLEQERRAHPGKVAEFASTQAMVLRELGRYMKGDDEWFENDEDPFGHGA